MLELLNPYFPTFLAKTFFILTLSFVFTCLGIISAYLSALSLNTGSDYQHKTTTKGVTVSSKIGGFNLFKFFWLILAINIISVLLLFFVKGSTNLSLGLLFLFTFTEGIVLGILLLPIVFLAAIALLLTIILTVIFGAFGYFTNIDFEFLGVFLFIGLISLVIAGIYRIFNKVSCWKARIISSFGVLVFIGYLIFDFNNLRKLQNIEKYNNWETAIESSTNIYLDMINLFLYILDLLSE